MTDIPPHNLTLTAPPPTLKATIGVPPAQLALTSPPVVVTNSITLTTRWTFYDPTEDETYVFPINPDSEKNPFAPKGLSFGRGRRAGQRSSTWRGRPTPTSWEFGGVIRTQAHHDAFYEWVGRRRIIHVKDHLGRVFECYLTSFEPTDRKPAKNVPWRLRYLMKAQILRQLV